MPAAGLRAQDVMPRPVVTVAAEATPEEAIALLREARVRRLPIVDGAGSLAGIVCLDDLVHHLGGSQT